MRLSGWVHNSRDLGGLLFVDLRDHYGVTQLMARPESPVFEELSRISKESVIQVTGVVAARSAENVNPNLPTGAIEVEATALDGRRRAVILRVDGREALVLTGGPQDVFVGWL